MIAQTVQLTGISPETLYTAYLSSREHSAMTAGSRPAFFFRPEVGEVAHGQEGDENTGHATSIGVGHQPLRGEAGHSRGKLP